MKLTHYIYLSTALAMLTACGEDIDLVYTVGEADNAIVFMAGVSDGGQAKTRADENLHVPFASQTQLRLYVEGSWTKKDASTSTVTQYTNCSTSTANDKLDGSANDIHPLGSYSPTLYWDDYGTADPANIANRANGLAVFGVGVDGLSSLPSELNSITADSWTSLSWSVNTDGTNVLSKDLVVSKNLGDNSAPEKTGLKFDNRNSTAKTDNLLIFEHMMSKVTFILNAGLGFDNGVFNSAPEVILTRNKHGETSKTEYCYTSGTVNIKTTEVTGATTSTVKAQVTNTNLSTTPLSKVEEQALIFPGSDFGSSDDDIIARIKADDNIYYVSAKMIRAKLNELYSSEVESTRYKTKKGINYVITVNINKTDISVTATVKEWTTVNAAEESPVIDVNNVWGDEENGNAPEFTQFSFYRSTSLNSGYSTIKSDLKEGNYYKSEATVTKTGENWVFNTPLYWPNHLTHFQFRGVYPLTGISGDGVPKVELDDQSIQVIKVQNVAYEKTTFPSDLMIARPDVKNTDVCTNKEPGHTKTNLYSGGICATEGSINMHFNYMMSQVEVNLKTTSDDKKVNLTGAKVELVNVYNTGNVKLGDREAVVTGDKDSYVLNSVSGTGNENKRLSAIVPQTLTYTSKGAETNLRFKVTIYNTETPTQVDDVYYADVNPILKKNTTIGELIAPSGKWEAGQRYVYELVLTKTQIEVTASLKDWDEVEASENIWF